MIETLHLGEYPVCFYTDSILFNDSLLPSSGKSLVSAVSPSVFLGFVESEVWRILVNPYKMIFPVFGSPKLQSAALHQTLVLKDVKEASGKSFQALPFTFI